MKRSEFLKDVDDSALAIVGMACRFPGSRSIEELWRNLRDGVDSITTFSDEELAESGIPPEVFNHPSYVKKGAVLTDVDLFDAGFFGYTPREAELIDPQQRVFLECAYEALEVAGYDPERYPGRIGVYAGIHTSSYLLNIFSHLDSMTPIELLQTDLGNDKDFMATRLAYKLNLTGPAVSVQTACSTSLTAIHLACQSLLNLESDMALAGGVSIKLPVKAGYMFWEGGIQSRDGHTAAFDARGDGTVLGAGAGLVVLKRLEDAVRDGDKIYAVVLGSAINNDGADKVSFTAPSVSGQCQVLAEALSIAGVHPEEISYVEAHGTGTSLGDPVEIRALTQAYRLKTEKIGYCAIGSAKTNFGHLDTAAGVAGVIKTVLALEHKQIPPSLHFEKPNPEIDLASSPFYVNTELRDWHSPSGPRRAGVSAFGMGGTNAHVILEEAPELAGDHRSRPEQLLVLSARSAEVLETMTANLADHLRQHPEVPLADVAYTTQVGRRLFSHRRILVCRDREDALTALDSRDPSRLLTAVAEREDPPVVFRFPGAGSHFAGLAQELYRGEGVFREEIDRCAGLLGETAEQLLEGTEHSEAAVFAAEYALARLLMAWGIRPQAVRGDGHGEAVAACLAGSISLDDALSLAKRRPAPLGDAPGELLTEDQVLVEIGELEDLAGLLTTLGRLWLQGVTVDWPGFYRDEERQRTPLPSYPFERQRFWVERREGGLGAVARKVTGKKAKLAEWFELPVWRMSPLHRAAARGHSADGELEAGACWLLFADTCGLAERLAERLRTADQEVVTVRPGQGFERSSETHFTVRPREDGDYESLLRELGQSGKRPWRILHLWNVSTEPSAEESVEVFDHFQELGFYSLLALARALGKEGFTDAVEIGVVSTHLQDVTGDELLQPEKSTLLGPCRVITQELVNIACRSLDVVLPAAGSRAEEELVELVLRELTVFSAEPIVAFRGGRRWVRSFEPARLEERSEGATRFRDGGVYLITGGLGKVGVILARHLARTYRAKLVLTCRSAFPPRDEWDRRIAAHDADDVVATRIRKIREIEELGGEVLARQTDVSDPDAMRRLVDEACERFGDLHGVVHAAGYLSQDAFKIVPDASRELCEPHFRAKAHGVYALEHALAGRRPDFVLLVSSISSVLGGIGYSAYAAANVFLDAWATRHGRRRARPWLSLDWDSWRYDEEVEESYHRGTAIAELFMEQVEGVETMERALVLGEEVVVVSTGDLDSRLEQWGRLKPLATGAQEAEVHPRPDLRTPYAAPSNDTEELMARVWQQVLAIAPVGVNDDFFELGGHSLLATQLLFQLRQAFGTELPLGTLFEVATVAGMSQAILASQASEGAAAGPLDLVADAVLAPEIVLAADADPVPSDQASEILLTGATGFLGAFLLAELLRETGARIHCLARARDAVEAAGRVRESLVRYGLWEEDYASRLVPLAGDLAEPLLGLSPGAFAELAATVDAIFHCAAFTNFIYPYAVLKPSNVLGTQEILRLASQGRGHELHFVSTVGMIAPSYYSEGRALREDENFDRSDELTLGYTQSKWVAEKIVKEAISRGFPVAIYRPATISGHSLTGACQTNDYYWRMIKACIQLGSVPDVDSAVPFVPVDFVARSIVHLAKRPDSLGRVFHLSNPDTLSFREIVDWMESYGYQLDRAAYGEWRQRLLQSAEDLQVDSEGNAAHPLLSLFSEAAIDSEMAGEASSVLLDRSNTLAGIADSSITCPPVDFALLETYFSYFIKTHFLEAPKRALRPIPS